MDVKRGVFFFSFFLESILNSEIGIDDLFGRIVTRSFLFSLYNRYDTRAVTFNRVQHRRFLLFSYFYLNEGQTGNLYKACEL